MYECGSTSTGPDTGPDTGVGAESNSKDRRHTVNYKLPYNLTELTRLQVESVLEFLETDSIYLTGAEEGDYWDEIDSYLKLEGYRVVTRSITSLRIGLIRDKIAQVYLLSRYRKQHVYSDPGLFAGSKKKAQVIQLRREGKYGTSN